MLDIALRPAFQAGFLHAKTKNYLAAMFLCEWEKFFTFFLDSVPKR